MEFREERTHFSIKFKFIDFYRGPGVYLRSQCLFEMGILNQDYVSLLHTSSLSTILFEFIH